MGFLQAPELIYYQRFLSSYTLIIFFAFHIFKYFFSNSLFCNSHRSWMETEFLTITPDFFLPLGFLLFLESLNSTVVFYAPHRFWIETEIHTIFSRAILPLGFLKFLNLNSCILWLSLTMQKNWNPCYSTYFTSAIVRNSGLQLWGIYFATLSNFIMQQTITRFFSVFKYKQYVRFSYFPYICTSIGINSLIFCSHRRFKHSLSELQLSLIQSPCPRTGSRVKFPIYVLS